VLVIHTIIPATQEAEICRMAVGGQLRQKVHQIQSQQIARNSDTNLSSQATQEAEIGRITVPS
jgi:hypothetical protein